jgi:chromosome partitioning protein
MLSRKGRAAGLPKGESMRIIVLASQKGGSGKTTLAGHLAVQAELSGAGPVALIDTDPQGSLAKWWNAREAATPAFVAARFENLQSDLDALHAQGFKMVFIDTPPAVTKAISHVVGFADLVIMPTRPSPHDLRAVGATVEIASAHNKAMVFVINAATARAKITSEAAVALSQHGTVAPVMLNHRVDFAASMTDGRTVMEYSANGPSTKEVRELWSYLDDRLRILAGGPRESSDPVGFDFEAPRLSLPNHSAKQSAGPGEFDAAVELAPFSSTPSLLSEEQMSDLEVADLVEIPSEPSLVSEHEAADSSIAALPPVSEAPRHGAPIDAAFDAHSNPAPLRENPQLALLEAVLRLRGELDYPETLDGVLPAGDAGMGDAPEILTPKETAPARRGLSAPFLNRMIGFGRRG